MKCLFNACKDPCQQEAQIFIRGDWKYGLCLQHFQKVRNRELLTLNYEYQGQRRTNLTEKIEKELKKHLPLNQKEETWSCGFRIGFKRGYALAHKEATEKT